MSLNLSRLVFLALALALALISTARAFPSVFSQQPGLDLVGPASWNWWFYMMVGGVIFLVLPLLFKEKTRKAVRGWFKKRCAKWRQWRDKERDTIGWGNWLERMRDKMAIHTQTLEGGPTPFVCPPKKTSV